jgi:hypothetical protein
MRLASQRNKEHPVMERDEIDSPEPSQPIATIEPGQLWDKIPTESAKAFEAFAAYRDLERRSFTSIAEKLNCSTQNICQWASKYNWKGRTVFAGR